MDIVEARQSARNTRPSRVRDNDYYAFDGGLNLTATPLQLKPGELIGCLNYEISDEGGYRRIQGFERYDGQQQPSDASYWLIEFNEGVTGQYPQPGDLITTSGGASMVCLKVVLLDESSTADSTRTTADNTRITADRGL
jgi:hypothetical protein